MKHTRKKRKGMKKHMLLLPVFLVAVVALILGASAADSLASGWRHWLPEVSEFDDAECGFEVNLTDFDTGFTASVDAEAWKSLRIYRMDEDHSNKQLLFWTGAFDGLRSLGLTELRFESDEPPEQFETVLAKFPEGICKFFGKTVGGDYLLSFFDLSWDFACAPDPEAETAEIRYSVDGGSSYPPFTDDTIVPAGQDLIIEWDAVTTELDEITGEGEFECGDDLSAEDLEEISYEVFVETGEVGGEDIELSQTVNFDPFDEGTEVTIPGDFLKCGTPYKFELLVHLEGNASIIEIEFETTSCPQD